MAGGIWCSPLLRRRKEEPCPCYFCSDLGAAEGPVNEPQDRNEPKYPNITVKTKKTLQRNGGKSNDAEN